MSGIEAGVRNLAGSRLLCLLVQTFTFVSPSPSHHESGESSSRGLDQLPNAISACELSSVLLFGLLLQLLPRSIYSQAVMGSQEPWVLTAS